jgi:pyridoxine kinase
MARVLCMSSQTVFGPVGNSAAVPALQASGHEVMQIPTVILSNHPGLAKPVGQSTSVDLLEEMFAALHHVGAFLTLDAVMTGYFVSAAQVIAATKQIAALKSLNQQLNVLVDPVIGDHGALYVARDVAEAIRDHLLPLATITTPNLFELQWLAETNDISSAVQALGVAETIVTSIPDEASNLHTELHYLNAMKYDTHSMPRYEGVPHGTGDYLAGCYLAERLRHPAVLAFSNTMQRVETAIAKSLGLPALKIC